MMRIVSFLVILGLILAVTTWMPAFQDGGDGLLKRPLDLPSGGLGGEEDDEDAPETVTFFGTEYEGDGFFWCLDRSGSMAWGGRIGILKQEMSESINTLSSRAEFSIVSFSSNFTVWSERPRNAGASDKGSATAWVQTLRANGWTCLAPAATKTIEIANLSSKRRKQVIILGDGVPICNGRDTKGEVLAAVSGANWQHIPVNTVYISTDSSGRNFFKQLALANGGTFTIAY